MSFFKKHPTQTVVYKLIILSLIMAISICACPHFANVNRYMSLLAIVLGFNLGLDIIVMFPSYVLGIDLEHDRFGGSGSWIK